MMLLPKAGLPRREIFETLESYRSRDIAWRTGRTFGFVYDPGNEAEAIGKEAYAMYLSENGLDPTSFPSLMRLENEVVAMAREMAGGGDGAVGAFTSGGTESILLAVKAARDMAREQRPDLTDPEMVLPVTAHAAFHKAGHYLGVRPVVTAADAATCRADVAAMERAVGERTILVVASAPSYAHGVVDPVAEIAAMAARHGVPCHVDACVGGWLLPFFRRLGADVPAFDLSVPGVTSLSMDLHKYAFAPKGASVILYRDAALRRRQVYACARWTGYSVVNMAVQSSRSGGPMAAAWAVCNALGEDGYLALARAMRDTTMSLVEGIGAIEGLRVLGEPRMSLLAFAWDGGDVFHLADEMRSRGWYVQPQLPRGGFPRSIHLTVGPTNAPWVDAFLADLRSSQQAARSLTPHPLAEQLGEMMRGAGAEDVPDTLLAETLDMLGAGNGSLPERQAAINQILEALSPQVVERALQAFMDRAFR